MDKQLIRCISSIIYEEREILQYLELDIDSTDTPNIPEIYSFCETLRTRSEKAITELKAYLYQVAGVTVKNPLEANGSVKSSDFFENYRSKLDPLGTSYEALEAQAVIKKSKRLLDISCYNKNEIAAELLQLNELSDGYRRLAKTKSLRPRLSSNY